MKNSLFLISAFLFLFSPMATAQEEMGGVVAPDEGAAVATGEVSPLVKELSEKVAKAFLGNKWQGKMNFTMTDEMGGDTNLKVAAKFQDMSHFAFDITMMMEDPFEGEVEQTFNLMSDGEWLYLNSPDIAQLSGGMANGPIKVNIKLVMQMMGAESEGMPSSEELVPMLSAVMSEMLGAAEAEGMSLAEKDSTEELRRYEASMEAGGEKASMVACFCSKSFMPMSIEMTQGDGESSAFKMETTEMKMVEEFSADTFVFTVPEGVVVTDLTPMLQMSMQGAMAPAEEDLEF